MTRQEQNISTAIVAGVVLAALALAAVLVIAALVGAPARPSPPWGIPTSLVRPAAARWVSDGRLSVYAEGGDDRK